MREILENYMWGTGITHSKPPKDILLSLLYLFSPRSSKKTHILHLPGTYTVKMAKGDKGGWGQEGTWERFIPLKIWDNLL